MPLTSEKKKELIQKIDKDSGSVEAQIAFLTAKINNLTEHLIRHKGDIHSKRGLMMIGKRKRLLSYFKKKDEKGYFALAEKLSIRVK